RGPWAHRDKACFRDRPLRPSVRFGLRSVPRLIGVGGDLHADDLIRIRDRAVAVFVALLDRVDIFHAGDDLAEGGVFAVEEERRAQADEELAVGAVGIWAARHAERAAQEARAVEFGLEILARAAG